MYFIHLITSTFILFTIYIVFVNNTNIYGMCEKCKEAYTWNLENGDDPFFSRTRSTNKPARNTRQLSISFLAIASKRYIQMLALTKEKEKFS